MLVISLVEEAVIHLVGQNALPDVVEGAVLILVIQPVLGGIIWIRGHDKY